LPMVERTGIRHFHRTICRKTLCQYHRCQCMCEIGFGDNHRARGSCCKLQLTEKCQLPWRKRWKRNNITKRWDCTLQLSLEQCTDNCNSKLLGSRYPFRDHNRCKCMSDC